jgi:beta subunit of N-acylethanolamine-hydrolyzing acid amidase
MTPQSDSFQHSVARQDSTSSPGPITAGTSPSMLPPNALPSSARFPSRPSLAPPRFFVNLSDPPETRYAHIALAFQDQVDTLPALYQEVLETLLPTKVAKVINRLSRLLLRNLFDKEETSELQGISKAW